MISIHPIPAFDDNYIWLLCNKKQKTATVVDPGDASPVIDYLKKHNLTLTTILITHHHYDHTNGVQTLTNTFPNIPIYGPESIACVNHPANEQGSLSLPHLSKRPIRVIETPGHTLDHIAYLIDDALFCGDTLFAAGCGRVFEGTAQQMHNSLQKLFCLPPETKVYCAHEYTQANLQFAQAVEPDNIDIYEKIQMVRSARQNNQPTLPSNIEQELATNPFLRCHCDSVIKAAEQHHQQPCDKDPVTIFAIIRQWKDNFKLNPKQ